MNQSLLSLEQTPPLSVPLIYMLTAPFFAALAAIIVFAYPESFGERWTPVMLTITHLITLGFITMVMVGALQQLFPVLVGVSLSYPVIFSRIVYAGLTIGVLTLCFGFFTIQPIFIGLGASILGISFLALLITLAMAVMKSDASSNVTIGMKLGLISFLLTISLGLYLAAAYTTSIVDLHRFITTLHMQWAFLGWVGLLVFTVSYQVVPMFQVTPKYPQKMVTWLAPTIFISLILVTTARFPIYFPIDIGMYAVSIFEFVLFCGFTLYAIVTIRLQLQRRRKVADVTLEYWRFGLYCLLLAAFIWATSKMSIIDWQLDLILGVLVIIGFTMSLITGMLYKIIPFLVWLHLTNSIDMSTRWDLKIPNMKEIIPDRHARNQFWLHLLAVGLILVSLQVDLLVPIAAIAFMASNLYLGFNLVRGALTYRHVVQKAELT